jgi:ABC-type uncharacterized transport system substrate-binding protein
MIKKSIAIIVLSFISLSVQASTIFVVSSYDPGYKWDAEYIQAIKDSIPTDHELILRSLDSRRLPSNQWQKKAAEIVTEIQKEKPDVVVIGDDNAMASVAKALETSGIPIVFLGINGTEEEYGLNNSTAMTGVFERPFIVQSIRHITKVLKNDLPILVLMDNSAMMQNAVNEHFRGQRRVDIQGTRVDFLLTDSAQDWKAAILDAHETYGAVVVGTYHTLKNGNGTPFSEEAAMTYAQYTLKVPLFALWDFSVAPDKAAGGYVISAYEEGKAASRMVKLVLSGVPVSNIVPSTSQTGHYIYSKKGMEKWGIQLSPLVATQAEFRE